MFIRNPYDINSQYFYSDEYLDAEENYKEYCYERMIPPFFPSTPGGPLPSTPPMPQPSQPSMPQPSQPPRPQPGQPPGPPPSMVPAKPFSVGIQPTAVSPGSIRPPETNVVSNLQTQVLSPAQFKLEYPFIENAGNMANQEIIDALNSLWLNEVLLPEKINFIIVESAYEVPLNSNGLLSIVMSLYTKTQDNPSGNIAFNSLTVDVNTGKVYDLGDLFNTRMNYAKTLSDIAIKKANEMNVNFIEPYNGVTDTQQFYLTPGALVLYYQVGEYTPASMGLFRITIPYNEISNILYPESPIVRLMGTQPV